MEVEEQPKSRLPLTLLGLIAIVGLGLVAVVGYYGYQFQEETRAALEANPVIRENLGDIESLEFDLSKSTEHEDIDTFVMRVHGTLGDGEVTAALVTRDNGTDELVDGELRLEDGRILPLFPEEGEEGDEAGDAPPPKEEPPKSEPPGTTPSPAGPGRR